MMVVCEVKDCKWCENGLCTRSTTFIDSKRKCTDFSPYLRDKDDDNRNKM